MKKSGRKPSLFSLTKEIVVNHPKDAAINVALYVVAGLADGIGIATLLPLLNILSKTTTIPTPGSIDGYVLRFFNSMSLDVSLFNLLALVVLLILAKSVLTFIANVFTSNTTTEMLARSQTQFVNALLTVRWPYFVTQSSGKLAEAVCQQTMAASSTYITVSALISQLIQGVIYIAIAMALSWQATLGATAFGALTSLGVFYFTMLTRTNAAKRVRIRARFNGILIDVFTGMKSIKAMGLERLFVPILDREIAALSHASKIQIIYKTSIESLMEPIKVISLSIGIYMLSELLGWKIEQIIVIGLLFLRSSQVISQFQIKYNGLGDQEASYRYVESFIKDLNSQEEAKLNGIVPALSKGIQFNHVDFGYDESKPVLVDASFTIPAYSFVCLRGASGAGKTTIFDLIIRLLIPKSGTITIDGTSIEKIDTQGWREQIGYVPQETILLHDTILKNITVGDDKFSEADVEEALRMASAYDFVADLPEGLQTMVGERGLRLSGGQRQRIALARAIIRRPQLLILDEATAALDSESEKFICESVKSLKHKMTVLAISHQATIASYADVVLVLENQKVVKSSGKIKHVELSVDAL